VLTPEERQEIQSEIDAVPQRRSACIAALKVVQRHRKWVSDEALHDIAEFLQMGEAELDGIATFYNLVFRRPVGRHVILMCNSVSCWTMGEPRLRRALEKRLGVAFGETTSDGRFTLLPVECLGDCDHAPAMMVDEDLHHDLEEDRLEDILKEYE
jgi:NADH-quinone oxidoreductase subunit E